MNLLRGTMYAIAFYLWTGLIGLIFVPLSVLSRQLAVKAGPPWAKMALWLLRPICGISQEIRGEHYKVNGPVIYAVKHQSAWETLVFWALFPRPVYVFKKELLAVPVLGQYLWRGGHICIDRKSGGEALKQMIAEAKERLAEGRPIVIYPEGTRTAPHVKGTYQPGVAALYSQLKVPVIPVALNSGLFWGKNSTAKTPGTVLLEFLPPIPAGLKSREFLAQLETAIETATERLVKEGEATPPLHPSTAGPGI